MTGLAADRIAGTLLGVALGDALGLPAEAMSARSIARRFGPIDRSRRFGPTGFVSDDPEQAALVAQSLARHPDEPGACVAAFRRTLLGRSCRLPWGVGLATIRACVRIALGRRPTGQHRRSDAGEAAPVPRFSPGLALARNLALYPVILAHGFRRLVPS